MESQVISKKRVADHGEVLTGDREVNAMLDLVKQETERIESRFLEPACGTGNFLTAILKRKLAVVEKRYGRSQLEYDRNAVLAVSSIYGIDILEDNVRECRRRLVDIVDRHYSRFFKEDFIAAVTFIIDRNIIWGDALTYKTVGENPQPIVFSEWSPVNGSMIKRRDFKFEHLVSCALFEGVNLFSDLGETVFIPEPVKDYPPVHFLEIAHVQQ
ncbi:MAG: SAM-dependent DNA methyltransferase [Armatimonadota bacterium]